MASATKSQWSERAASALMAARLLDRSPSSWSCSEVKLSVAAIAFLLSQTKLAACIQSTREGNRSLGLLLLSDIVNKSGLRRRQRRRRRIECRSPQYRHVTAAVADDAAACMKAGGPEKDPASFATPGSNPSRGWPRLDAEEIPFVNGIRRYSPQTPLQAVPLRSSLV